MRVLSINSGNLGQRNYTLIVDRTPAYFNGCLTLKDGSLNSLRPRNRSRKVFVATRWITGVNIYQKVQSISVFFPCHWPFPLVRWKKTFMVLADNLYFKSKATLTVEVFFCQYGKTSVFIALWFVADRSNWFFRDDSQHRSYRLRHF